MLYYCAHSTQLYHFSGKDSTKTADFPIKMNIFFQNSLNFNQKDFLFQKIICYFAALNI